MARLVISAVGHRATLEREGTDVLDLVTGVVLAMVDSIAGRPGSPEQMINMISDDLSDLGWRFTTESREAEDEVLQIHAEWIWSKKDLSLWIGRGGGGDLTYWQGMLREMGKDPSEVRRWVGRNGKRVVGVVDITEEMVGLLDRADQGRARGLPE